jgi:hypothetical protein
MKPIKKDFEYFDAETSKRPGYLKWRFKKIAEWEKRQREADAKWDAEQATKVLPLTREKKA